MKKLHQTPIATCLLKIIQKDIKDFTNESLVQIMDNTISFRITLARDASQNGRIRHTFTKLSASLKKYNSKYSLKLHLYFNGNCGLSQTGFAKLGSDIATHFRHLREFTLSFFMCDDISDEKLNCLLVPLSRVITKVKKLTINLCRCQNMSNYGLEYIKSLLLVQAKNLKKLSINFSGGASRLNSQEIIPTEINIARRIRNYINVKSQSPMYLVSLISYQGVLSLIKIIARYLKNLEKFTFVPLLNEDQENISAIVFNFISKLRKLRVFSLGFYSYGCLNAEQIENISLSIGKNLLDLEYLALDFKDEIFAFEVTDHLLKQVAVNTCSNLRQLRGIALGFNNFHHTRVSTSGLSSFISQVCQYSKDLEELVIDIDSWAYQYIEWFMKLISQGLCSLKNFTINSLGEESFAFGISSKPRLYLNSTDQLVSGLSCPDLREINLCLNTPCRMPVLFSESIEILALSFSDCKEMTDRYFEMLVGYIFDFPLWNLQELTLIFNRANKISDNEIKSFSCQGLAHITNLRCLTLKFSESSYITDITFKYLEPFIQANINSLKKIDLTFQDCEKISEAGIRSITLAVTKNMRNLEELRLSFSSKSTKEAISLEGISTVIERIAQGLKKLRKLELDFSFKGDRNHLSYYDYSAVWPTERFRKKLDFISVVKVYFGSKHL